MPRPLSITLVILGAVLLVIAMFAGDSVSSGISSVFRGTPDDRTIILLVSGILSLGIGLFSLLRTKQV